MMTMRKRSSGPALVGILAIVMIAGCDQSAPEIEKKQAPAEPAASSKPTKALQGGAIIAVTASSFYGNLDSYKPENAFDGDETTAWAAAGGNIPSTITITAARPGILESIKLVSRQTALFEQWHIVKVKQYLHDRVGSEETFSFSDAATQRTHEVSVKAVESEKIELEFSEPVTKTQTGQNVKAESVSPGYAEIVFKWRSQ